jgi:EAL domain-containing protein (putative c-di-GMP-specific phosphodiesterase class I)
MEKEGLERLAARIQKRVREELRLTLDPAVFHKFGCYVGSATAYRDEHVRLERLVHNALETALADSDTREAYDAAERRVALEEILRSEGVRTLVHPIYRLDDLSIIGYEALSRGVESGEFERPDKLFNVAYDADLVMQLERLCRRRAFQTARNLPKGRLLFINVEPEAVGDPELRDCMFTTLLEDVEIRPSDVVLEITERTAIADFGSFRATLEYLRTLGFGVAVDDGGAGYASLQVLAEVRPEWLKIDISLIRGIDADDVRRSLVASMVMFAERVGVRLIAEGIESEAQLETLRQLGVEFGQGFFFCEPVEPFPTDGDVTPKI